MPSEVLGSCGRAPNFTAALQHPKPAYGSLPTDTAAPHIAPCPDTSRCPPSGAKRTVFVYNGGKEDAAYDYASSPTKCVGAMGASPSTAARVSTPGVSSNTHQFNAFTAFREGKHTVPHGQIQCA